MMSEDLADNDVYAEPPDMFSDERLGDAERRLEGNDNEFVLSIMQEYERAVRAEPHHNESVIYKPLPPPTTSLFQDGRSEEAQQHVSNTQGRSCQTSFDIYLNKSESVEHLIDSDAPLSTIPSDRSEEQKSKIVTSTVTRSNQITNTSITELDRLMRRASNCTTDSSITPRSDGITPASLDTSALTPRDGAGRLKYTLERSSSIDRFPSKCELASSSKIRSRSSSSKVCSSPNLAIWERNKRTGTPSTLSTVGKYASMSCDSLRSRTTNNTNNKNNQDTDLQNILDIIDINQMLLDDGEEGVKDDSSELIHRAEDIIGGPLENVRSKKISCCQGASQQGFVEAIPDEDGRFLADLLLESKKIKSLAEEIFSNAGYVTNTDTASLNQSRESLHRTRSTGSKSRGSVIGKTRVKEDAIQQRFFEDVGDEGQCSCKCDICKSQRNRETGPQVISRTNSTHLTTNQCSTTRNIVCDSQGVSYRKLPPDPRPQWVAESGNDLNEPMARGLSLPNTFSMRFNVQVGDNEQPSIDGDPSTPELPQVGGIRGDIEGRGGLRNDVNADYHQRRELPLPSNGSAMNNIKPLETDHTSRNKNSGFKDHSQAVTYDNRSDNFEDYVEHLISAEEQFQDGCPFLRSGNDEHIPFCPRVPEGQCYNKENNIHYSIDNNSNTGGSQKVKENRHEVPNMILPKPPVTVHETKTENTEYTFVLNESRDSCCNNDNKNNKNNNNSNRGNLSREGSFNYKRITAVGTGGGIYHQRNVTRELEFLRTRCSELTQKLKVNDYVISIFYF